MFTGSRKRQSVLSACLTPPFQFPALHPGKRNILAQASFCRLCLERVPPASRAQGSPLCVPALAHHMVTWTLCQAYLLIGWGEGESPRGGGEVLAHHNAVSLSHLFISWFRLLGREEKRHGAYCKLSVGHRVRAVITTTASFPSSSWVPPSSLFLGLGSKEAV